MGSFPALAVRQPEGPLDQITKVLQVKAMLGQEQERQMQLRDQQAVRQAFIKNNGDLDATIQDAAKLGASPQTLQGLQQHAQQMKNLMATGKELQLKNLLTQNDVISRSANAVLAAPAEKRPALYAKSVADLQGQGILPQGFPTDYPGDDEIKLHAMAALSTKDQIQAALDERKTAAQETEAQTKAKQAELQTQEFNAKMPGGALENPKEKYIRLQSLQRQGKGLSQADQTWIQGYEKEAGLRPNITFGLQQQGVAPSAGAVAGKTGQDFLSGLPAQRQQIVRGIAEGRVPMPSAFALKTPYWQSVMNDVLQYDPEFSTQRAELRKNYTVPGQKGADQINAINVVMNHFDELGQAALALKNQDVNFINKIANEVGAQIGATPKTTYDSIVRRVGPEISKVYGEATGGERIATEEDFSSNRGQEQILNNIRESVKLVRGKMDPLEFNWNNNKAPGSPEFKDRFITPKARASLDRWSPQAEAFKVPAGAPPAPKEDGKVLKLNGQVVAKSQGGQWGPP